MSHCHPGVRGYPQQCWEEGESKAVFSTWKNHPLWCRKTLPYNIFCHIIIFVNVFTLAASLLQYDQHIQIFCREGVGKLFCFHLFDKHFFQAAEQGSEIVVKQVRVALILNFFIHDFCFPGSFQAEFCVSHSFPLSKQVELQIWPNILCPSWNLLSGGGLLLFHLQWIWKRTADYCQDQTCFYRLLLPASWIVTKKSEPKLWTIWLFSWSVNWSAGGGLALICDMNLCLLNLRANLLLKYWKVIINHPF